MNVGLLTLDEKNQLVGQTFAPDSFFNPVQDADLNWIISMQEINYCVNPNFIWVKNIPIIPWNPVIPPLPSF